MADPTLADALTLGGYGLGLYWSLGGPNWTGVVSLLLDEVDGRVARKMGQSSVRGGNLDWGADVALTPLALLRLGRETGHVTAALVAAPVVLYAQAELRAQGYRPPIGSARAAITLAAMAVNIQKTKKLLNARKAK